MDSATTSGLTVPLFLLGAGITLAVCAITIAGWKHKFLVWGLLGVAVLLALAGIFWKPFSEAAPAVSKLITDLARSQTIWFLAIVAALFSTIASTRKLQRVAGSNPSSPPYDDTKLSERFSAELDG